MKTAFIFIRTCTLANTQKTSKYLYIRQIIEELSLQVLVQKLGLIVRIDKTKREPAILVPFWWIAPSVNRY